MMGKKEYRDARPGEVLAWLAQHSLKDLKRYPARGEVRFRPSPCCGHDNATNPSCQVEEGRGMWRCFACGKVGNWFTLTREFGDPLPEGDRYRDPIHEFRPEWIQGFSGQQRRPVSGGHYPDLLAYCHDRGIRNEALDLWRVSSMGKNNLRWPIYLWHGDEWQMVNAKIRRALDPNGVKGNDWFGITGGPTNLLLGNHLLKAREGDRAIITEGQWDAMTLTQIGMENVFSLPNGAQNVRVAEMLRYIPEHWEIWLAMDRDEKGDMATEHFFHQLGPDRVARIMTPTKDLNDWLKEKPDLKPADVEGVLQGLTPKTMVSGGDGFMEMDMEEVPEEQTRIISDTPFEELNTYLAGGFRPAQTTGILAPSGLGKTTLVNQLGIWAANHGVTVGLISLEGSRGELKTKLQDVIKGTCDHRTWKDTVGNMIISKLEGLRVTAAQCIAEMQRMAGQGARLLIFDNPNFITRDDNRANMQVYGEVIELSTAFNVHSLVVWQPNKVDREQIINSGNQKGFSQMLQDADNYLNVNRVKDYNRIQVEKCRAEGVHGDGIVWMVYEKSKRAFLPVHDAPDTNLGNSSKVVPLGLI